MNKNISFINANLFPLVMVCIFEVYLYNFYVALIGLVLIASMLFLSYKTIFGTDYSESNFREDKDICELLEKKEAFTKEEYQKISNPNFWVEIMGKLKTIYAHSRNTTLLQFLGLVLFFFFSEMKPNDALVLLMMPTCYMGISRATYLPFFKKLMKIFKKAEDVAAC